MMTELSLNVLDVAQNSVKAEAKLIEISVEINTEKDRLIIGINDDGFGMTEEQLEKVVDPFFTTRTTRKVGLGVSFFKEAAEMTGGSFSITSKKNVGTKVLAEFVLSSIDRIPLGDMNSTIKSLIVYNLNIDFLYRYKVDENEFTLSTVEFKEVLGGVSLDQPEVTEYIGDYLKENTEECNKDRIF